MKKLFSIFIAVFVLSFCNARAQNDVIDSLRKKLSTSVTEDTQKVNLLLYLTKQLILTGDFDKAIEFLRQAEALAKIIPFAAEVKKEQSTVYNYYGIIYFSLGHYPEALANHFKALKLREELSDKKNIAATYHNIGNVYYAQKNRESAMKNFYVSLKIKKEMGDTLDSHYAHTINNIGNYYEYQKNYSEARKYYTESYKISTHLGDMQGMISSYCNLGNLFIFEGNLNPAFEYYFTALKISQSIGDKQSTAGIYNSLGNLYFKLKKIKPALSYLTKGLEISKQIGSKEDELASYSYLADLADSIADYKASLNYYKLYTACKDSLNNEEITKKSIRLEMNYEFEKKEAATLLEQEKKESVTKAESRKQQVILWSVCGILVLVFAFAVFAYRSYLQKQKANIEIIKQKHIVEEKQKEILDSIYYARRIQQALLASEKYIGKNLERLNKISP